MLNRKGHIPTAMLLIVAIILIIAAWFSFVNVEREISGRSDGVSEAVKNISSDYDYVNELFLRSIEDSIEDSRGAGFEIVFNETFFERIERIESVSEVSGNFFGKIRNRDYRFYRDQGVYFLEVDDVFVQSSSGANEMRIDFNLSARFDESGIIK